MIFIKMKTAKRPNKRMNVLMREIKKLLRFDRAIGR